MTRALPARGGRGDCAAGRTPDADGWHFVSLPPEITTDITDITAGYGKKSGELFRERMNAMAELLAGPGAALRERVAAIIAASGLSIGWMFFHDQAADPGRVAGRGARHRPRSRRDPRGG